MLTTSKKFRAASLRNATDITIGNLRNQLKSIILTFETYFTAIDES